MYSEQAQLLICQVYYDKLARKDWKWNATVFVECSPSLHKSMINLPLFFLHFESSRDGKAQPIDFGCLWKIQTL